MDLQVQKLTAKGQATRQRIIEGAAAEIRERGVAVATLDDIRARTQTSKSQLFHYFPEGKEQLLLAVAEHEAQMVLDDQQPYLGDLTSWAAWQRWRDAVVDRYRRQGQHCPLAVLMSEIGRTTPGAQAVTSALMRRWHDEIAAGVRHMQAQDKVAARLDADRVAAALLAGIQGGVGVMLATGDLELSRSRARRRDRLAARHRLPQRGLEPLDISVDVADRRLGGMDADRDGVADAVHTVRQAHHR